MALFNDLDGDLVAGLDEERDDGSDAGHPGEAADGRGLAVGAELDVDEDEGEAADDVANGQTVQESGVDTGDVGGDDGGGVEADGLEAIVGSGLGAGDALLGLDELLVGKKEHEGGEEQLLATQLLLSWDGIPPCRGHRSFRDSPSGCGDWRYQRRPWNR